MSAMQRLVERLSKAEVRFEVHDHAVTVPSTDAGGFTVSFAQTGDGFEVSYDGWCEQFDDESQALHCFAFGLSDQCRLKVFRRVVGGDVYRWTVEYLADGQWLEGRTVGVLAFPLRQDRQVEYKQNAVIRGAAVL